MCMCTCEQALSSRAFVGQLGSGGQFPTAHVLAPLASVPLPPLPGPPVQEPLAVPHIAPMGTQGPTPEPPAAQATTWQSPAPCHPFSPCHSPRVRGWRPAVGRGTAGLPRDVRPQGGPRCPSSSGLVPAARSTHPIPGWGLGHPLRPPSWCGAFPGAAGPRAQPGPQSRKWRRLP